MLWAFGPQTFLACTLFSALFDLSTFGFGLTYPGQFHQYDLCVPQNSLPQDAIVVKGGTARDVTQLAKSVARGMSMDGVSAISVFALPRLKGESRSETILRILDMSKLPHGKIQVSTVGELEASEFRLVHDTPNG